MPLEVDKVVCYVIHDEHLLVFTHDTVPLTTAGVQVPAGSIEPGEPPERAAERELLEETGRPGRVVRSLGVERYDVRPTRDEVAVRHCFLMSVPQADVAERWSAGEHSRSDGGEAVSWTCWWIPLQDAHVLAAGLGGRLGAAVTAVRQAAVDRVVPEAPASSWPRAVPLLSARLALEPLAVGHASEMATALSPPELYRFTGGEPPTREALSARYDRQAQGQSEDGSAGWSNWIIRPADGGPAIGFVQATLRREDAGLTADVAWLVTPSEQGRGIAVEASSAVVAWLQSIGVGRIRAFIHPDHTASERVARRIRLAPTTALVDGEVLWEALLPPTTEH